MRITFMPDKGEMSRHNVETIDEFLSEQGLKLAEEFAGPNMYLVYDGIPTKADIQDGLTDVLGSTVGTIIVRSQKN